MSEDQQDGMFRGPGLILAPCVPPAVVAGVELQQQLVAASQHAAKAWLSLNPFLRPFLIN